MKFKITQAAAKKVKKLIASYKTHMIGLRVAVDGGGCSGFTYQYTIIAKSNDDDYVLNSFDIIVAIDKVSQEFLYGCTIDFIEELGASFFQIKNPNAISKCGCGNSFAV